MIGTHPCYRADKDLVIPVFAAQDKWSASPWLTNPWMRAALGGKTDVSDVSAPAERRSTLAYFSGNLAHSEPIKYARGIRHRLWKAFHATTGWKLVGNAGYRYSADLRGSQFCLVPPGGDGWSSRVDDAVRHGCIPVILIDNVHLPFESLLNYTAFALRVPEAQVERLIT